jgi:hypothetical protein
MELFFTLYSAESRHSRAGLQPKVIDATDDDIIAAASREVAACGNSLAYRAEIWRDERGKCGRRATDESAHDKILRLSIAKLGDAGRLYQIFPMTIDGGFAFLRASDRYEVFDDARALIAICIPPAPSDDQIIMKPPDTDSISCVVEAGVSSGLEDALSIAANIP